jgi:glycosyltransferase involved in cell wall biosynthesis/SAM-dependent methyltransferase
MQYHSSLPLFPSFPTSLFFPASLFNPWPPEANMEQTGLLDYPFDLYQRTRDIREIVDIIVQETGKNQLKILDIGGFRIDAEEREDLLLKEFLPGHDIYCLDLEKSAVPGYIQGDGTQLPFKENIFDIVVTSDVYEHVVPEEREKFLENLVRVVKPDGFVILGAPFYSEKNALAENILFEYIRKVLYSEHEQLKEHIQNQLPDAEELKHWIKHKGLDFICFECGNLDSWLFMMIVKHYLMSIPDTERLHNMLDRFYNMNFYESDHQGEGYRKFFVIAKEKTPGKVLKKIETHFTTYAQDKKYQSQRLNALAGSDLSHVRMLLDLETLKTRSQIEEKDAVIKHQAAQINAFNHMRSTRVYRVMQFFNRLFLSPFLFLGRQFLGKMQQVGQVLTGKRRHPFLSISEKAYRRWLKKHEPTEQEIRQLKKEMQTFKYNPLISIVVPAYNTPRQWLEKAIESVIDQWYQNWELCIVNDGSPQPHVRETLDIYSRKDKRIKVKHLGRNRGIARATNEALALALNKSEFIAFMDSDDALHPTALFEVVKFLNHQPDADVIYSDEDKLTLDDRRRRPEFKPDWSPNLLLTYNYINHLTLCRKKLVDSVDGFRAKYNWSQDYDLYLRITEKTNKVFHIPKVLYHWREIPESSASKVDVRPKAHAKSIELLTETLHRRGIKGIVKRGPRPGAFKIKKAKD